MVLTDTFHKPGFKMHARILMHLFVIAKDPNIIREPLWDATQVRASAASAGGPPAQRLGSRAPARLLRARPRAVLRPLRPLPLHLLDLCAGPLSLPLPQTTVVFNSNIDFVATYTADLLATSFPNMARAQVRPAAAACAHAVATGVGTLDQALPAPRPLTLPPPYP